MKLKHLALATLAALTAACATSCHHIDDHRVPPAAVYIPFTTEGMWITYGVASAYQYKYFIKAEKTPQGYPYSALSETGFAGILLASDYNGVPVAYDLCCPVECRADVRVAVQPDSHLAECPVCHSLYEVCTLNHGLPVGGPAAQKGYGLTIYRVIPGGNGEFMIITN